MPVAVGDRSYTDTPFVPFILSILAVILSILFRLSFWLR